MRRGVEPPRLRRGARCTSIPALRPGLVFMTFHFPDQVDTNVLTIEATDPKSGTAEFKATAVRIDKLPRRRASRDRRRRLVTEVRWTSI